MGEGKILRYMWFFDFRRLMKNIPKLYEMWILIPGMISLMMGSPSNSPLEQLYTSPSEAVIVGSTNGIPVSE
jgi:hypothetical protein